MGTPILVTGASTGIGNHITQYLAEHGHLVYAAARKTVDLERLRQIENVTPIQLDVTNLAQIKTAVSFIEEQGTGLYGLVNNAGLGGLGGFTTWTETEFHQIFDVNVAGPWRMTNAFVDLLIAAQGRVVNIGSQGGMITQKFFGPYTMTKHALEAYTVALSEELRPYHVKVSVVQPGGIVSNIGPNSMPENLERFRRAQPPFKEEAEQILASFENPPPPPPADAPESATNRKPSSPEIVSTAVYDALFAEEPKLRYLVGTKWEGDRVLHALIEKLVHENDNPQHNYSRAELIAMLDSHLDTN